jgi:hypothetical protein
MKKRKERAVSLQDFAATDRGTAGVRKNFRKIYIAEI